MKYYTWKLKWDVNPETGGLEGTDPTGLINNDAVYAQPQFATGDLQDPSTLIYVYLLQGEIDPAELTDWSVTETTAAAMLEAAQEKVAEVTMVNGVLVFPLQETQV